MPSATRVIAQRGEVIVELRFRHVRVVVVSLRHCCLERKSLAWRDCGNRIYVLCLGFDDLINENHVTATLLAGDLHKEIDTARCRCAENDNETVQRVRNT